MRFKKTACAAAGLVALLTLAACGGGNDTPAPAPASAPASASAPAAASAPVAASETAEFSVFTNTASDVTATKATLTFAPGSTVGTLATATAPNYATLTADAANDAVLTVGGTPNFGLTAGTILETTPVLLPGVIETCEAVAGQGTANPAVGGALTKSTNVMVAGPTNGNVISLVGHTFNNYFEDCLRDGGTPTVPGTHSSLTIDPTTFAVTTTDVVHNVTTTVPFPATEAVLSPTGFNGRFLVPFFYIVNGQFRLVLVEHNAGRIGVWLE
jgi:hypothetical protein